MASCGPPPGPAAPPAREAWRRVSITIRDFTRTEQSPHGAIRCPVNHPAEANPRPALCPSWSPARTRGPAPAACTYDVPVRNFENRNRGVLGELGGAEGPTLIGLFEAHCPIVNVEDPTPIDTWISEGGSSRGR